MSEARAAVLARVRQALAAGRREVDVPRRYRAEDQDQPRTEVLDLLTERLRDYGTDVRRVAEDGVASVARSVLAELSVRRLVVPPGLDPRWRPVGGAGGPAGLDVLVDDPPLPVAELDTVDATLVSCAVAVAETGTVVLDAGSGSGRRAISLVPDVLVCVVPEPVVVHGVPAALRRVDPTRPLTFVSGPSATSDIELDRVTGVHGPRTLVVLVATPS